MPIDLNEGRNKKILRESIQAAYPDIALLTIFVDEELNENLQEISAANNLRVVVFCLINWAISKGRVNDLYEAFKKENPNNLTINEIEQPPLISSMNIIEPETLDRLFLNFEPDDFPDIRRAFRKAFSQEMGRGFNEVRPNEPIESLPSIRILLEEYDKPTLTARFGRSALEELERSNIDAGRDFSLLQQWMDEFSQLHHISIEEDPTVDDSSEKKAYLLVSVKESGQITQGSSMFNIFAEIHVPGEDNPIDFDVLPTKCSFEEVAEHLSVWILKAEETLGAYGATEVTIEFFMPWIHLEKDLDDWEMKDENNQSRNLLKYRVFMVRSLDRISSLRMLSSLSIKWKKIIQCVEKNRTFDEFCIREDCPKIGDLLFELKRKLGLQIIAGLPANEKDREDVLYDIVSSSVPFAFWYGDKDELTLEQRKLDLTHFLQDCCPLNFADLAYRWSDHRVNPCTIASKHLRLLCDRPDRIPSLPDLTQDDDLVVAS